DPPRARPPHARHPARLRGAGQDLRRARAGERDPPPARLPRPRHHGALDRGDRLARRQARRGAQAGASMTKPKPSIPLWRWTLWWVELVAGMFVFYVLLTPIWVGL